MQSKPNETTKRRQTGIHERHSRSCQSSQGGRCSCTPSIRAWVYDRRAHTKTWKTFTGKGALTAAKRWRANATSQVNDGKSIAPSRHTLLEAAEAWLEGAKADPLTILNRSGRPYKPSVLRGYEQDLRNYVLDDLGSHRLTDIRRGDLQVLVDRLLGKGLSGSRVRNVILPVRVIYRHALERDEVNINPTTHLRLPNGSEPRGRTATAAEAADLLSPLPKDLQPIYATAFYGGLRRGEVMALRWKNVDLAAGTIRVAHSWDERAGEIEPKSEKGKRIVPISNLLRDYLTAHKAATGGDGDDFVFGSIHGRPFTPSNVWRRSHVAWDTANKKRKKKRLPPLVPIGLHECRHTYVTLMHDAGVSLEVIGDLVGHSSVYMTDRYRHLLDGAERDAARKFDEYLARADTASRVEQLGVSAG
jgi:integrase